ncbi:DNA-binding domain-containing protein [Mesorhizobium sp. KR9-304]|uniref:HvfC/BufC N-terminal domain-containing protein n=1 Tax=Mesorhizobium sp. KR9-304 TaxID=3156614 RepID=UPI0032B46A37
MGFEASQDAFAQALLDTGAGVPDGVTSARGEPDALRFAVYRNNVFVGLTKALEKRFPVTARLVGEEFFAGMARAYADAHKPRSPLLFLYGDGFADFIAAFPPAGGVPYLADVARVEAAWTRAYHAADADAMTAAGLATIAPEALGRTRLARHPSAELVMSAHPAGSIWAAHQGDHVEPVRHWCAEAVLVVRPGMDVSVHVVPARDAAFAGALLAGETLADAAQRAIEADSDSGFDFGAALVGLVSLGAFSATHNGATDNGEIK